MNIYLTFCRDVGGKKLTDGIIALLIKRLSSGVLFTPAGMFYAILIKVGRLKMKQNKHLKQYGFLKLFLSGEVVSCSSRDDARDPCLLDHRGS